ncbi:imidazole glycerol phosphate synthase subunit HisF [Flavobacterium branchiophilum NBRC 15030 = ATCC 35035]|uniref:imidazole glycerol-phosphate synthase n=1 Tax=Flavobacterium branchiophilum TaxID=55197 RepID=A0A543G633_9FLAO|nr:AglZ/HisF2 family acetamidino modification protein [Flavobacterium branchiophilum]OXA81123.1 imidazole glycerol phosphate synthase subunit HisF [Flavobacterium branchiophilum NBRC 15030 = ATCC 35035]TQM41549.1 cyclase [Flavobacterium branchiophilum]GEM55131.1 putative imidazole glycerol phosphate synthase subunit hisF2 [Flavobacterium branchiophilum NBRC 15030 = ATCC 35035]
MYKPRVIPVLLLKDYGLVKSINFKKHRYIGDPINAVKIFNDLKADELVFLDINATKDNKIIDLDFVKKVGEEANMPFSVGGGIKTLDNIESILKIGVEKCIIGTFAIENPNFIKDASDRFGSSTIGVCIDVKKDFFGREYVYYRNGSKKANLAIEDFAKLMQEKGAGELIIQSIDNDGTKRGYNLELIDKISKLVSIPIVALGGAKNIDSMQELHKKTVVNGFAAGSMFVYHGNRDGILINYPDKEELKKLFL